MSKRDHDLEQMMRRADPASTPEHSALDADAEATLRSIIAQPVRRNYPSRERAWWVFAAPAFLAAAVVAIFVMQIWSPFGSQMSATAQTPPLLQMTPVDEGLAEIVQEAQSKLLATEVPMFASRGSTYQGWYLHADGDAGRPSSAEIAPEDTTLEWSADLSGRLVVRAGHPYLADDPSRVEIPSNSDSPPSGVILRDEEFGPGDLPVVFKTAPPNDPEEMKQYLLQRYAGDPAVDTLSYVDSVRLLLNEWTLSGTQHAAILSKLAESTDVEVAGYVADRTGRPGIALRIKSQSGATYENLLIISERTGRIIALETIYVGGDETTDLPAPSVVNYVSWK